MDEVIENSSAKTCQIRVLIVADGDIHFKPRDDGFSLTEFVAALEESVRPWEQLSITKAVRDQADRDDCTPIKGFIFNNKSFNIDLYDEVWLFGQVDEENEAAVLSESEKRCLYDFMNQGGGVFATGDHESLGFPLCGSVPRVLSMRKWQFKNAPAELKAPGREDLTRIDTLRMGVTSGFQLTDQTDVVPQEIRPKFYGNAGGASYPHPILADRDFAITVMPDHMHEGECTLPKDLTRAFSFDGGESVDEYPRWPNTDEHSRPDTVAISTSGGGALTEDGRIFPPVEPKSFFAIVAYDGHLVEDPNANGAGARLGRVVVDSSFHHFLDLNLKGFKVDGVPTPDYLAFKKYYRNTVSWLYPAQRKFDYYMSLLLQVRFSGAMMAELTTKPTFSLEQILRAGYLSQRAITAALSSGEAIVCALAMLMNLPLDRRAEIEQLINPWLPLPLKVITANPILNSDFFVNLILGIAILNISSALPTDKFAAADALRETKLLEEEIWPRIAESVETKLVGLLDVVRLSQQLLANF